MMAVYADALKYHLPMEMEQDYLTAETGHWAVELVT